jgi:hypothetical protein
MKQAGTLGSQAKAPQFVIVPSRHVPAPSQTRVDVSWLAPLHVAVAQIVEPSWKAQAPLLSHAPVVPQPIEPWLTHVRDGSSVPAATCVHVPSEVGSAQLEHCPQLAEKQQTPSTQLPLPHSFVPPQVLPRSFFCTQAPPPQK